MKKVLYVEGCQDGTVGGSHTCLYSMVANLDRERFFPVVVFYDDHIVASRFRSLGVETHIFNKYTPLDFSLLLNKMVSSAKKIPTLLLPLQKALNLVFFFLRPAIHYALFIKKEKIDIVHLNNSVNSNHDWMVAAKIAGVKVISHERGINNDLPKTSKLLGERLDLMICMSKVIENPLIRQGFSEKKLITIYDGIDLSRININRDLNSMREAYGLVNGDPVIGVVGNIKEWKGQETVVRATGILKKTWPGIKCLLVGGTVDGDTYKSKLERIIEELGIKENIVFTGFQNNPPDFVNAMDVMVHSSIQPEPFGMVNLEAMYMKKPVVSTNMGGPTEIFVDGEDGILIEAGNPELLARKIAILLDNPEMRRNMGQKAYDAVVGKFQISDTVRRIEGIYQGLFGQ